MAHAWTAKIPDSPTDLTTITAEAGVSIDFLVFSPLGPMTGRSTVSVYLDGQFKGMHRAGYEGAVHFEVPESALLQGF